MGILCLKRSLISILTASKIVTQMADMIMDGMPTDFILEKKFTYDFLVGMRNNN